MHGVLDDTAAFRKRLLDQGPFEGLDMLGQGHRSAGRLVAALVEFETAVIVAQQHEAFGDIAQLAHIARPVIGHQPLVYMGIHGRSLLAVACRRHQQEMLEQQRDVFPSLAQRRDFQGHHIEAVVEILAERAARGGLAQVDLAGGDDADVEVDGTVRADALEGALLQHAQQPYLCGQGHGFDLVEEQGAALGILELADARGLGPGKGAFLVAEELAFDEMFRDRAAVDGDEVAVVATALFVQGAGDQVLADAGFPEQQQVRVGVGELGDAASQLLDRGRLADDARSERILCRQFVLQLAILQRQQTLVASPPGAFHQPVGGEGLFDEVIGPLLHGFDRHGNVAMPGDQDHGEIGVDLPHGAQKVEPVHARQADVADQNARPVGLDLLQCLLRRLVEPDAEAGQLQALLIGQAQVELVVDEQDVGVRIVSHDRLLPAGKW